MGWCLEGILFCQRFNPLSQYLWLPIDGLTYGTPLAICPEEIEKMWQDTFLALNYRPQGKSKVGGPRNNWRQSMLQELERVNYSSPGREHQQTTTEGTDVLCSSGTDKD